MIISGINLVTFSGIKQPFYHMHAFCRPELKKNIIGNSLHVHDVWVLNLGARAA